MSRAEERDAELGFEAVSGLRPEQLHVETSAYFAAFAWEPPEVDPARLTAAAFFARVLDSESDTPDGATQSASDRYLDSVEIELVEESSQPATVAESTAASQQ